MKYILSWEHSGDWGKVFIFPNGNTANMISDFSSKGKLEYIPQAGEEFFTFRVGVQPANGTATYKNIQIIVDDI